VKPPGWGSTRGDLAPSLSYEVLAKAKELYREDYLLYERLKRADVRARAEISRRPPRRRRVVWNLMCTQVETVVRGRAPSHVVGTIYSH